MIEINNLSERDIGKWVVFKHRHGVEETGRLKRWNNEMVFVVFSAAGKWHEFKEYTGQSCDPKQLRFFIDGE